MVDLFSLVKKCNHVKLCSLGPEAVKQIKQEREKNYEV